MDALRSLSTLSIVLLVVLCGVGACTGMQEPVTQGQHYYDKTEVDLVRGRPEASVRYHRPQGVQRYISDETDVDLARPRTSQSAQPDAVIPLPAQPQTPSVVPRPAPGSGR